MMLQADLPKVDDLGALNGKDVDIDPKKVVRVADESDVEGM